MKHLLKKIALFCLVAFTMASCGGNDYGHVQIVDGTILATFSVGYGKQVYFSKGNLQYNPYEGEWRFAEQQFSIIGEDNKHIIDRYSYRGWIDLFCYGTSGVYYSPTSHTTHSPDYPGDDISGTSNDWGINKISNGGNKKDMWRTLSKDEWEYVFKQRTNAEALCGPATVCGFFGMILLPDNWDYCSIARYEGKFLNIFRHSKEYGLEEWRKMESHGAVFLPAAGSRYGTDVDLVGSNGYYWSSSARGSLSAGYLVFYSDNAFMSGDGYRSNGHSVRLVRSL